MIFEFNIKCDKIFHFTIRDRNNKRSEPEYYLNENMEKEFENIGKRLTLDDIGFSLPKINDPFYFSLKDKNGNIYYHFDGANFLYTDTLIIFDQLLTTRYIYGFGERNYNFNLDTGRYTIWGNDTTYTNRDRRDGGWNLMGHQPVGLHLTKFKKYLGLLFLNGNCQDVVISDISNKKNNKYNYLNINDFSHVLRHITIGGIINYYITLGDTAEESIIGLHSIYGHPAIPPFWGLGWHQCKWGYKNTGQLKDIRQNYLKNDIPLDALWTDIDMMEQKRNFHLNHNFIDVPDFIKYLHNNGQHFIALVDYGIPKKYDDPYYRIGANSNAFLYSNFTKEFLISDVWPGESVFPDFFLNEGIDLWKTGLTDYDNKLNFDGMWIDMNEPAMTDKDGNTLTLGPGDELHFADGAMLIIDSNATLIAQGSAGQPVLFTSLRHDPWYRNMPGQWQTVWFYNYSLGNVIDHAVVENGVGGLRCYPGSHLTVSNTVVRNCSDAGIIGQDATINGDNLLVYDCFSSVVLIGGGDYSFGSSTFADYWNYRDHSRDTASVIISNYFLLSPTEAYANHMRATFSNSIIYGNWTRGEAAVTTMDGFDMDARFVHSIVRGGTWDEDPMFTDPSADDYTLQEGSPAEGIGYTFVNK